MNHISVMLKETVDALNIKAGDIVLDGTLGGGGHTEEIVKRFGDKVKVIGLDLDLDALKRAKERVSVYDHDTVFKVANFKDANTVLDDMGIEEINSAMLDLGLSSFQLEVAGRGFSFQKDEPLMMTMKKDPTDSEITASDIVNTWSESTLSDIIFLYGEERYARRIAKAIVSERTKKPIETTFELVSVIERAVGKSYGKSKIHPATRTFQALRIAVNSELSSIEYAIPSIFGELAPKGRLAIISFHSLEDRIVKNQFKTLNDNKEGKIITKKPLLPTKEEIINNPRSRSAKLRIIEKI